MEFTKQGLHLTEQEAKDLAEVFGITASIYDWGPMSGVVKEPSIEEKSEARDLRKMIWGIEPTKSDENYKTVNTEHFPTITKIAEIALANSQKIISGLCTPDVCTGYRSDWRPVAYRILAMTAEVSEGIKWELIR